MRVERLWSVAVTGLAAGAVLFVSGQGRWGRSGTVPKGDVPTLQASEHHDNAAGPTGGSFASGPASPPPRAAVSESAVAGERRYLQTCAACHGPGGLGQPHMGANLRDSRFVREQSDDALVAFVKTGRPPGDPRSVLGLSMPARGGNPSLEDGQIRDIVVFLRTVQARARAQDAEAKLY